MSNLLPISRGLLMVAMCLSAIAFVRQAAAEDGTEHAQFFEQHVRPVLVERCHSCHGAEKEEFGLRLDSRAAVLAGSDDGEVVVAGNPGESKLIQAIHYDGDIQMPPKGKLEDEEIAALTRWVELGLPWPQADGSTATPILKGDDLYRHARENLWSLQPIQKPEMPSVQDEAWPRQPLDRLVLAKLEAAELTPSPEADRRTLIRRASFDLLGLPPTPEEVEAFVNDDSPQAYERLIDRLLASPAYGERWARHWLDLARYADTKGYAFGRERKFPYAYTYRDWVIKSLNADMSYDEFIVQQLAADRLQNNPVQNQAALGFLTVGRQFNNSHDNIDDQIDVVTRGLLGLTVACARCHDHKYDAIETEDYYSLYGVFASCEPAERVPADRPAGRVGRVRKVQHRTGPAGKGAQRFHQREAHAVAGPRAVRGGGVPGPCRDQTARGTAGQIAVYLAGHEGSEAFANHALAAVSE